MKKLIPLVVLFGAVSSVAFGSACMVGDNVLTPSYSCTLATLTFSNFSSNTNSTLGIDIGAVGSSPVEISFNPNLPTNGSPSLNDIFLQFEVSGGVSGVQLNLNGNPNSFTNENICTTQQPLAGGSLGVCQGVLLGFMTAFGNGPTQSVTFASTDPVWIFKDINDGGGSLSEVNQTFVPEPMTMTMLGAGLLGLGALGRRRLRK